MAQNDRAVVTAAVGYVYIAEPGTARPSPAQLKQIDAEAFGAQSHTVKTDTAPTSGSFKLSVGDVAPLQQTAEVGTLEGEVDAGAVTLPAEEVKSTSKSKTAKAAPVEGKAVEVTADIAFDAAAGDVQAALEALPSVGAGNVKVSGAGLADPGFTVAFVGSLHGKELPLTVDGANLVGGTATAAVASAPNGWSNIGHTSREDLPEFGFDGGDTEVRGTWQNESLREVVTDPIADYLTMALHQFDVETFELYYGKDAAKQPGVFGVSGSTPTPVEKALFIIIVDGDVKVGFYSPKASLRRDDSIQLAVDEFAALPVRATFLKHGSSCKFEWINEDLFIP